MSNSVLICNEDRVNQLNERLYLRNLSVGHLDTLFSFRPQPTKYRYLPILDSNQCVTNIKNVPFNTHIMFNPGDTMGPWSGYASNINKESILKNQISALQNNPRTTYVPHPDSDLYVTNTPSTNNSNQPFPHLFKETNFSKTDVNFYKNNTSNVLFNNHTRQQLKDN